MPRTLAELTSAAAVQAALDEFLRVGQDDFLRKYGFGRASNYLVQDPRSGLWADSKAIAGAAMSFQYIGEPALKASQFSGGIETVVRRLTSLGFVVKAGAEIAGQDWKRIEVELIVADYLSMLLCELAGQPYNKAAHRRRLMQQLPGRSAGAIEFKHSNISAALLELGLPYISGYLPRSNFQREVLMGALSEQITRHAELDQMALVAVERPAAVSAPSDFSKVLTRAPRRTAQHQATEERPAYLRPPIRRDYLAREEYNRSLGRAGELFAVDFERWRLERLGVGQLAQRVRHVAATEGDGHGYDIHSFEIDGSDRFIEVKTTSFGDYTPFFVSQNEVKFARDHETSFRLYRLFNFRKSPQMFELSGPIERHCRLDATTFRAAFD